MRVVYLVVLIVLLAAIAVFALQNDDLVKIRFMDWARAYPLSLLIAAVYLLGMISGSSLIGLFRRTVHRVTEPAQE